MDEDQEDIKYFRVTSIVLFSQGLLWGVSTGIIPPIVNHLKTLDCKEGCAAYLISLSVASFYAGKIFGFPIGLVSRMKIRSTSKLLSLYIIANYIAILLFGLCYNLDFLFLVKFIHGLLYGYGDIFIMKSQLYLSNFSIFWWGFGVSSFITGVLYVSSDNLRNHIGTKFVLLNSYPTLIGAIITSNFLLLSNFILKTFYVFKESDKYSRLHFEETRSASAFSNILIPPETAAELSQSDEEYDDYGGLDLQVSFFFININALYPFFYFMIKILKKGSRSLY